VGACTFNHLNFRVLVNLFILLLNNAYNWVFIFPALLFLWEADIVNAKTFQDYAKRLFVYLRKLGSRLLAALWGVSRNTSKKCYFNFEFLTNNSVVPFLLFGSSLCFSDFDKNDNKPVI